MQGELDNRTPGRVTGWLRFFRTGQLPLQVQVDLDGDFHDDIRGSLIQLTNPKVGERSPDGGTYMEGFDQVQSGTVGDMTAGISLGSWTEEIARKLMDGYELLWDQFQIPEPARTARRNEYAKDCRDHIAAGDLFFPYVNYPYFEWYSSNGRVVLELRPEQVTVVERTANLPERSSIEQLAARIKQGRSFAEFLEECGTTLSGGSDQDGGADASANERKG